MKAFLTLSCLTLIVISCSKPVEENCTTNAATIAGNYKVIASVYKQTPTSPEEDLFEDSDPCDRDDVLTLKNDNTYQVADLGEVCVPSNDEAGTWSLNGLNLMMDGEPATIKSFNCMRLELMTNDVFLDGDQITLTLQKQ
jgi:hypothetical protein